MILALSESDELARNENTVGLRCGHKKCAVSPLFWQVRDSMRRKYTVSQTVSRPDYRIPNELLQLLNRDSYSLLIKGSPGSGKTTLALTILRTLNDRQNFLYVSTRTSQTQLFRNHTWLAEFLHARKDGKVSAGSRLVPDRSVFVDARLDEQSTLFETITNELMDINRPLIIIDSWEAIANSMDTEAITNMKVLQTWRERAGAKLIFISEGPEQKTSDFLVDGIAILRQNYIDGRRVREILLSKLDGMAATKSSYFFTLSNGIFRSFDPYRGADFAISMDSNFSHQPLESTPISDTFCIPTHHPELDKILRGGFPIRSVVKIKMDPIVNVKVALVFLMRMLTDFFRNGNPVVFQPFEEIEAEQVTRLFDSFSADSKEKRLSILWPPDAIGTPNDSARREMQTAKGWLESLKEAVFRMRREFPDRKLLALLELKDITEYRGPEEGGTLKALMDFTKRNVDLCVIVTRQPETVLEQTHVIAETHLEIVDLEGTLFLRAHVPYSQFFAIIPERQSGILTVRLEPMV